MLVNQFVGKTVYLLGCLAEVATDAGEENPPVSLIGLFDVEEFHPFEPSAYVYSPCFGVVAHGAGEDPIWFYVPVQDFIEQVDPKSHASMLVEERISDLREAELEEAMMPYYEG